MPFFLAAIPVLHAAAPHIAASLGPHIISAMGSTLAHSSSAYIGKIGFMGLHNIIGAAGASSTSIGAMTTLYQGGNAGYKVLNAYSASRREQEAAAAEAAARNRPLTTEDIIKILGVLLVVRWYKLRKNKDSNGTVKTDLEDIRFCQDSSRCRPGLKCFDFQGPGMVCLRCGCSSHRHDPFDAKSFQLFGLEWLQEEMARELYPLYRHRTSSGVLKTDPALIQFCQESGCGCWDFRIGTNDNCICGHEEPKEEPRPKYSLSRSDSDDDQVGGHRKSKYFPVVFWSGVLGILAFVITARKEKRIDLPLGIANEEVLALVAEWIGERPLWEV